MSMSYAWKLPRWQSPMCREKGLGVDSRGGCHIWAVAMTAGCLSDVLHSAIAEFAS